MAERRIEWKWVLVSIVVFLVIQVALSLVFGIFGVITLGFGFVLFVIVKPLTYFIGGIVTGRLSPGVTIREPAIGAVIVSVLGIIFDASRAAGGRILWMIVSGVIAFFLALAGAQIGERMQRQV
jgi:hypothetical protein